MNNQELRTHLSSSQAKLVYLTITGEHLSEANENEMLSAWANLKWKKTENTRLEYNNDDFVDQICRNEPSERPQDGFKGPPPLLHQLWFRPPALKRFHSRFNNAAVYRGLAHLALKQASMAANEFRSGGLHNHAAALDLIEAFEQNENDARITSSPPFKPSAKKPQNSTENPCSPTTQRCQMIERNTTMDTGTVSAHSASTVQSQTQEWRARLLTTCLCVHKIVRPKKDDRYKALTESKHAVDT